MPAGADPSGCRLHQAKCASRRGAFRLCVLYVVASLHSAEALVIGNAGNRSLASGDVKATYFLLMRVGYQATGRSQQPRSPHNKKAKCLTAGGPDRQDGIALGWEQCQDATVMTTPSNPKKLEAQSFKLQEDGSVLWKPSEGKEEQLCIRRVACEEGGELLGYVYDLANCHDDVSTKVQVKKVQANSMTHMRDMGYLSQAVRIEKCKLCGPYQLMNMCMGSHNCGGSYQAKPGWTKLASQYVGDDVVAGHSEYGDSASGGEDGMQDSFDAMDIDMSGIGPTKQRDGLCGSFTTDAPAISSFYYALDAGK